MQAAGKGKVVSIKKREKLATREGHGKTMGEK